MRAAAHGGESRPRLLTAAQGCIRAYSSFLLRNASQEFDQLRESMTLADAFDRTCRQQPHGAGKQAGVRQRLQIHVQQLEWLPSALASWIEGALDDEHVDDKATRTAVLAPLAEVAQKAQEGIAAAQQLVAASG